MIATPITGLRFFWKTILLAGLLAGSVDLVFALLYYGNNGMSAQRVLQSIAGGVLGKAAFQGGIAMAALGFFLHYLISCLWAAVYLIASRTWPELLKYAVPCGLVFGSVIYFFMNGIVLPLSALQTKAWPLPLAGWVIAIHVFGVGLPIALVTRKRVGNAG